MTVRNYTFCPPSEDSTSPTCAVVAERLADSLATDRPKPTTRGLNTLARPRDDSRVAGWDLRLSAKRLSYIDRTALQDGIFAQSPFATSAFSFVARTQAIQSSQAAGSVGRPSGSIWMSPSRLKSSSPALLAYCQRNFDIASNASCSFIEYSSIEPYRGVRFRPPFVISPFLTSTHTWVPLGSVSK